MAKFIAGLALFCVMYALMAWGISVLVSYVFAVDFGFWKTVAALLLLSIVSSMTFGRFAKSNN